MHYAVASLRSNGQWNGNLTLETAINTSVSDKNEWYTIFPEAVWGINNSINFSSGMTPHKLMFGFDQFKHPVDNVTPEVKQNQIWTNKHVKGRKPATIKSAFGTLVWI